jgi:hypothetical protein
MSRLEKLVYYDQHEIVFHKSAAEQREEEQATKIKKALDKQSAEEYRKLRGMQ